MKQEAKREEGCEEGQRRREVQLKMGEDNEEEEERMVVQWREERNE